MSGVPKRSHEEGVTHPSSSSSVAKYPHEDSGSYPKSPHQPVTPPPAQVHHNHQQPHQHPQSQSQSQPQPHLQALPHPHSHSHSHSPLAAAASASAPYEVESRTVVKVARSEPRDGERRSPLPLVYRSPSLPTTVSSSDPHLTHAPVPMEPRDGAKDGREIRVESRENRSDGREIYGETKREIQGPKGDRDVKFERSVDDFSGKGNTGSYTRNDGREMYGETKREIQGPKSDRDAKFERPGDDFSGKSNAGSYTRDTNLIGRIKIIMNKRGRLRWKRKGMLTWLGKSRRITIEGRELLKVRLQMWTRGLYPAVIRKAQLRLGLKISLRLWRGLIWKDVKPSEKTRLMPKTKIDLRKKIRKEKS
ncbi:hypothetical protein AtNW77_Chr5g0092151 [Arabidopsis thaliana]